MHFFSPANVMKLLEIVRGERTSHEALKTAMDIGSRIRKVGVISGVCYGFIGNRMLAQRSTEAERLLLEGALPQEIDARGRPNSASRWGLARWATSPASMSAGASARSAAPRPRSRTRSASSGGSARRPARGYYLYEAGSRVPRPDPEVEQLILETAKEQGIERRPISKEEIVERMVYPMINEGARILEEGIAMRARRHRRRLDLWLWLAGRARRADVLRRSGRAGQDRRAARRLCRAGEGRQSQARAAARQAGCRRQGLLVVFGIELWGGIRGLPQSFSLRKGWHI